MSGESNYGGNGSVYWQTRHEENGNPVNFKKRGNPQCQDAAGSGDHTLEIGNPHFVKGRDPSGAADFTVTMRFDGATLASRAAVGATGPAHSSVVETKRQTVSAAAALEGALQTLLSDIETKLAEVRKGAETVEIEVKVPVINRPAAPVAGWELTVRWD